MDDFFFNSTTSQSISFTTSSNNPPTFAVSNITVDEDDPETTEVGWASGFDDGDAEVTQNLTLTLISNDHPEYFDGDVTITQGGDITFTPAADYFGVATLEAALTDDGPGNAFSTESFTISINPVDDPPTIAPEDLVLAEDDGTINLSNWLNFDPGFNETEELEEIYVEVLTNESLFTSFTEGDLNNLVHDEISFTLADNAFGVATFEVTAYEPDFDNVTAIVTITVNAVDDPPVFVNSPITTIDEGQLYEYAYHATDVEDEVTYEITKPDWLELGSILSTIENITDDPSNVVASENNGDVLYIHNSHYELKKLNRTDGATTIKTLPYENFRGMVQDNAGNIYISSNSHKIYKLDLSLNLTIIAGTGVSGYTGDGGAASSAQVQNPTAIDIDNAGNIYFIDNFSQIVRKIDTDGNISTHVGLGVKGYTGSVYGMAIHPQTQELYFSTNYNRLYKVAGEIAEEISANNVFGEGVSEDDEPGALGLDLEHVFVRDPRALKFEDDGTLWITTGGNGNRLIAKYHENTGFKKIAGSGGTSFSGNGGDPLMAGLASLGYRHFRRW